MLHYSDDDDNNDDNDDEDVTSLSVCSQRVHAESERSRRRTPVFYVWPDWWPGGKVAPQARALTRGPLNDSPTRPERQASSLGGWLVRVPTETIERLTSKPASQPSDPKITQSVNRSSSHSLKPSVSMLK